jgi:ketosteroid isomerase-like protein
MNIEKEILALEDRRYAAMIANDQAALEAMLHPDLIYTHSSAVVDTKASYLETLRSGKTRYKNAERAEQKVRICGDTALVTGRAQMQVEIDGQPKSIKLRFLVVWTKTSKGWKFVGWQSTPLAA